MKGIYCLLINISEKTKIEIGKKGNFEFPKGYYIYIGSALSPGENALENRIKRHLSQSKHKKFHWHIDYLLNSSRIKIQDVFCKESKNKEDECETSRIIENLGGRLMEGFGSSDCKCKSHLIFIGNSNENTYSQVIKKLKQAGMAKKNF